MWGVCVYRCCGKAIPQSKIRRFLTAPFTQGSLWALPRQSNNFDLEVGTINSTLCIGFKGKNNASSILVKNISEDSCLLTNSFSGLQRDIEAINVHYDCVVLFGIDKSLKDTVRIEKAAEKETREFSALNLEKISAQLAAAGISNYLSENPTHYLCNDAY